MKASRELIIDIGSASVGACIVEAGGKNRQPVISAVARSPLGASTGTSDMEARAVESLKTLLADFHKLPAPGKVRVVFMSPWYESRVRSISSKAEKPVRVSGATVARAVKSYHEKSDAPFPASGRERLESVVTQVYVNGYQTGLRKPVYGRELSIHLYESAADHGFVKQVTDTVHGVFPGGRVSFHSFPLAAFTVLRALRDEEAFTLIDIGAEVTDIAIVHSDGLRFLASFPHGSRAFVDEVAKGSGKPDGSSRLSLYARNELSLEESESFKPAFDTAALSWIADLQKVLDAALAETPVPRTTFVTGGEDELLWFGKVIADAHEALPARLVPLVPNFFQGATIMSDGAHYDALLSLEALFFHTNDRELIEL